MHDDNLMALHVMARFRAAACHARDVYPGAVGELLAHEIMSWHDLGLRLGPDALMHRVVADVLEQPRHVEAA